MEPPTASRFLDARTFVLATAAAAPTLGDAGRPFYPTMFRLIASHVNVHLPGAGKPMPNFEEMVTAMEPIPFSVNANMAARLPVRANSLHRARSLPDVLLAVLRASVTSPDALHNAIELIEPQTDAAMHGAFEHDSLICAFLRKTVVAFFSLSFDGQARLLHDVRAFVMPQIPTSPRAKRPSHPVSFVPADVVNAPEGPLNSRLTEAATCAFPAEQIHLPLDVADPAVSPHPNHYHEHQPLHPQPHLAAHAHTSFAATTAHYLLHREALRRRDHTTALDTLHRYYDCALPHNQLAGISAPQPNGISDAYHNQQQHQQQYYNQHQQNQQQQQPPADPHAHQYAALSLAIAHASLGHNEHAASALDDAVRASHAAADRTCHARALSWLAHIEPSPTRRRDLLLHAAAPLALARDELATAVSAGPPSSSSSLYTSGSGSATEGTASVSISSVVRRPAASRRMRNLAARLADVDPTGRPAALLLKAAAWLDHAAAPTALSVARLARRVARGGAERARGAAAVAALTALCGDDKGAFAILEEAEHELRDKASAGITAGLTNENSVNKTNSTPTTNENNNNNTNYPNYDSEEMIHHKMKDTDEAPESAPAMEATTLPESEILARTRTWLQFERAERRGAVRAAGLLASRLGTMAKAAAATTAAAGAGDASDLELDALEAVARVRLAEGDNEAGVRAADKLTRCAAAAWRPARVVDGLRLKAEAYLVAGAATSALMEALTAVGLGKGLGVERACVRAIVTLASAMAAQDSGPDGAKRGLRALVDVLPIALEGLGVRERARAEHVRAICLLGVMYGDSNGNSNSDGNIGYGNDGNNSRHIDENIGYDEYREEELNVVADMLERARSDYERVDDVFGMRDCEYALARVHDRRGDITARNAAAGLFLKRCQKIERRYGEPLDSNSENERNYGNDVDDNDDGMVTT